MPSSHHHMILSPPSSTEAHAFSSPLTHPDGGPRTSSQLRVISVACQSVDFVLIASLKAITDQVRKILQNKLILYIDTRISEGDLPGEGETEATVLLSVGQTAPAGGSHGIAAGGGEREL